MNTQREVLLEKLAQIGLNYRPMRLGQLLVWLNAAACEDVTRPMAELSDDALLQVVEKRLALSQPIPSECPPEDQYRTELLDELNKLGKRYPERSLASLVFHLAELDGGDGYSIDDHRLLAQARAEQGIAVG